MKNREFSIPMNHEHYMNIKYSCKRVCVLAKSWFC